MYKFNKKLKLSEPWELKYLFIFIHSSKKFNLEYWEGDIPTTEIFALTFDLYNMHNHFALLNKQAIRLC